MNLYVVVFKFQMDFFLTINCFVFAMEPQKIKTTTITMRRSLWYDVDRCHPRAASLSERVLHVNLNIRWRNVR